jgi:beta-glucanase (GH16 family)
MKRTLSMLAALAILCGCAKDDSSGTGQSPDPGENTNPDPDPDPIQVVVNTYNGYELLWHDEFEKGYLDMTEWNIETGTGIGGDFGTGQLDRATERVNNIKVTAPTAQEYGTLAIITAKEEYMDRHYTSGRINTKGKFSCGPGTRIEARIWARDVKYKGQGFAFWMMPAEIPAGQTQLMWPQGGEIDVMEYVGAIPFANLGSVHYAWSWENNQYQDWNHAHKGSYYSYEQTQRPAVNPGYGGWPTTANNPNAGSGGYHLYRIDWFEDRMEFSVDERIYHINYFNDGDALADAPDGEDTDVFATIDGKNAMKSEYSHHFIEWHPFEHEFYLILSAGVGGNDNMSYGGAIVPDAVFPCSTLIDYIRVYKRN